MDVHAPVASADANYVSVFIMPQQQYDELNEERRQAQPGFQNFNRRTHRHLVPIRRHFVGGNRLMHSNQPTQTCRPLLHSHLTSAARIRTLQERRTHHHSRSPLVSSWLEVVKLSSLFTTEELRGSCLHRLLAELFGGDVALEKRSIGPYKTDGGVVHISLPDLSAMPVLIEVKNETTCGTSDAVFELLLYYKERVRHILRRDFPHKGDWVKTRFPSILIMHKGVSQPPRMNDST